ncbi:flagellar motor protein MotB [Planctomycetes bacterium Pan216]|uniref:Flagellar motor protein MotB n=1 Tax=Kolteria novifilia TaxID=2527975 RepID=A0A518AWS7_9BACT|nr:flagellar motor protein MotB [Planctomycetes bacterium Pan216]
MADDDDEGGGVPDWVLTYGDMMSLLLCFFVLIAAMSEIKKDEQMEAIVRSLIKQFGDKETISRFNESQELSRTDKKEGRIQDPTDVKDPTTRNQADAGSEGKEGEKRKTVVVSDGRPQAIGESIYFDPDSATLTDDDKKQLMKKMNRLRGLQHLVEIRASVSPEDRSTEGSADQGIDLAYRRAKAVADYLVDEGGLRRELVRLAFDAPSTTRMRAGGDRDSPKNNSVEVLTLEASRVEYH